MLLDPIRSVFQFPFYRQVLRKDFRGIIGYLVYIGFLFAVFSTAAIYRKLNPSMHDGLEWAAQSVPALTFSGGKASSGLASPLVLRYPKDQRAGFGIDTSRTTPVTLEELQKERLIAYLTQKSVFVSIGDDRVEQYDFAATPNAKPVVVDAAFFRDLEATVPKIFYPVAWITAWFMFLLWKSAAGLVYAQVGALLSRLLSIQLSLEQLFKLAIYAQTPLVALQTLALFSPERIAGFWMIGLIVVTVYLWQALRVIRDDESQGKF